MQDSNEQSGTMTSSADASTASAVPSVVRESGDGAWSMNDLQGWIDNIAGLTGFSAKEALQQAAFMLCCDVIAQDIAKAPLQLRERTGNDTSKVIEPRQHYMAAMLADEPNGWHTWYEFVEMMGLWHCLAQNNFAVVFRNRFDEPEEIIPLQTARVQEKITNANELVYEVHASTMYERAMLGASYLDIPARDMIHVRGRMLDGLEGYATMAAGRETLEAGKAIEGYRKRLFAEDGALRGVFQKEGPEPIPELSFERLRKQLRELMRHVKTRNDPIVLESGMKFQAISANPDEAELTKQFEAQINATCRLLRVPPHKVFHLTNVKYENMETLENAYVSDTLEPICQRHEQRYAKILLSKRDRRRGLCLQHDREALKIRDQKALTERLYRMVTSGVWTIDEARAATGKNPLPNGAGQVRLIPANMHAVDDTNEIVVGGDAGTVPVEEPKTEPEAPAEEDKGAIPALRLVANQD